MCERCKDLMIELKIDHPSQLKHAISIALENIKNGVISDITTNPYSTPFLKVASSGHWDDIVSYRFICNHCGQQFELVAETYHGSGGWWKPVKKG